MPERDKFLTSSQPIKLSTSVNQTWIIYMLKIRTKLTSIVDLFFVYDFFISYGYADGHNYPQNLLSKLKADGFRVFLDKQVYTAGDDLNLVTQRRVRASSHMILVARSHAMQSRWVAREINLAIKYERRIIVIDVEE